MAKTVDDTRQKQNRRHNTVDNKQEKLPLSIEIFLNKQINKISLDTIRSKQNCRLKEIYCRLKIRCRLKKKFIKSLSKKIISYHFISFHTIVVLLLLPPFSHLLVLVYPSVFTTAFYHQKWALRLNPCLPTYFFHRQRQCVTLLIRNANENMRARRVNSVMLTKPKQFLFLLEFITLFIFTYCL